NLMDKHIWFCLARADRILEPELASRIIYTFLVHCDTESTYFKSAMDQILLILSKYTLLESVSCFQLRLVSIYAQIVSSPLLPLSYRSKFAERILVNFDSASNYIQARFIRCLDVRLFELSSFAFIPSMLNSILKKALKGMFSTPEQWIIVLEAL